MSVQNAEQIEYWNEQAGPRWVALQERTDAMLEPLGHEALDLAAPTRGESELDVGCGCGQTVLALAERVGPGGRVVGLDPSETMLELAGRRSEALAQVRFEIGDAQTHAFGDERFDLVFSRFGVMFFADPVAAFANLRAALSDGGRLVFVCWQELERNDWARVPMQALLEHVPALPAAEPGAPGPFSFADRDRVEKILREAGFSSVRVEASLGTLSLGGARTLDEAVDFAFKIGPASRMLADQPPATVAAARESVREALAAHASDDGVRVSRATWLVTARAR